MEGGRAIADIIFGDVNPSGKLPITFPNKLLDCPTQVSNDAKIYYNEGIFVGYRHYDKKEIKPLFPFGHGLSYTSFHYDNIIMEKELISGEEQINISIELMNTGSVGGAEVVQLYLQDVECADERLYLIDQVNGLLNCLLGFFWRSIYEISTGQNAVSVRQAECGVYVLSSKMFV